jgi:hypothetical protein
MTLINVPNQVNTEGNSQGRRSLQLVFSRLQEKYIDMAAELIVYTYFFSASEDVLPEVTALRMWHVPWLFS